MRLLSARFATALRGKSSGPPPFRLTGILNISGCTDTTNAPTREGVTI